MTATVLYVDDQRELPAQSEDVLAQAGYELIHTADPEEALDVVRRCAPNLVLVEVLLPGCDGFDLIERMGSSAPAGAPPPVVVVTRGDRTPQLYGRALELGVKEFLCKPVLRAQVLEAVLAFSRAETPAPAPDVPAEPAPRSAEGDLEDEPLPEVMAWLHRTGASGVLVLQRGPELREVELRNGSPVALGRHRKLEPIGDYLLHTGRIDAEEHDMLVDQLLGRVAGPREILLGMEAIDEAQLEAAVREQARGELLELFRWSEGHFAFQAGRRLEAAGSLPLDGTPLEVVCAGVQRSPEAVVRRALERRADLYASLARAERLDGAGLTPEQRADAESLTGECTLAEVQAASALDERTLYGLVVTGAVQLEERPVLVLDQVLKPVEPEALEDFDPATEPWFPEPEESAPADAIPAFPASPPGAAAGGPDIVAVASEIETIAGRMESQDDFELFEIEDHTRDADVRSTYEALREGLRLDRIPQELDELRALARKLMTHLERAYDRVRTEDLRRAFAAIRKKKKVEREEEEGGSRAVEAESWFRKGESFTADERYGQAVEAFGMAVHLDPQQGEYAAHLGWALYRTNPRSPVIRREALEHVAKGVKLAPDREQPLLFLARIFREIGDGPMAAKVLRRALRLNPDSPALVQEMCLVDVNAARNRKRGFVDRLRRR